MTFTSIDEYVASCPAEVRGILEELRRTVHAAAPGAEESISYQMPTISLDGASLVHFAAWRHHIGLYPVPDGDAEFERLVAPYKGDKGTLRLPLDQPIPYDLVARVVAELVGQRRARDT